MFDWRLLSEKYKNEMAESDKGSWIINNPEPYYWRAKFQSPYLPGDDFHSTWENRPQPMDHDNNEHRKIWARLSHQDDILSAPTSDMIKRLIERIHTNDHGGMTVEEILRSHGVELEDKSAGFVCHKDGPFTRNYKVFNVPVRREGAKTDKGRLNGVIHHGSIRVSYEGKGSLSWWTFLSAQTDRSEERHSSRPVFWPEECTDVNAVIVKFMFDEVVDYARNKTFR